MEAAGGDKSKPLIVYCQIGGDLETEVVVRSGNKEKRYKDPIRTFGRQSRCVASLYLWIKDFEQSFGVNRVSSGRNKDYRSYLLRQFTRFFVHLRVGVGRLVEIVRGTSYQSGRPEMRTSVKVRFDPGVCLEFLLQLVLILGFLFTYPVVGFPLIVPLFCWLMESAIQYVSQV